MNQIDHSAKFANWGPVRNAAAPAPVAAPAQPRTAPVRSALAAEIRSLRHSAAYFKNDPEADYPYATVIEHIFELGRDVFPKGPQAVALTVRIVSTNHLAVGTYAVALQGSQVYGPATYGQCETFAKGLTLGLNR